MYIPLTPGVYTRSMEVTITQFRRDLFNLVEQAMSGLEVRVTHKGKSFTLTPDKPVDRLSRITPMNIITGNLDEAHDELLKEMQTEWEQDWAEL